MQSSQRVAIAVHYSAAEQALPPPGLQRYSLMWRNAECARAEYVTLGARNQLPKYPGDIVRFRCLPLDQSHSHPKSTIYRPLLDL